MLKINKSSSLFKPLILSPVGRDYLWGGTRLKDEYGKKLDLTPLAETWECSTHPLGECTIVGGRYQGRTLSRHLKRHPKILGRHVKAPKGQIPILIKFIDAKENLSIQVHPDDKYAKSHENESLGKTEMWYVVNASKDASLVHGFKQKITKEQVLKSIEDGTIEKYMNRVRVKKNDLFFVPPGTIHGIGAGSLILEIQESSDLTYRVYDYNRVDKNGNKRELHIKKAMDVMNFNATKAPRQPMRLVSYRPGLATELLLRCPYFEVYRYLLNTETTKDLAPYNVNGDSFEVWVCYSGCGTIVCKNDNTCINFFKGDTIFIPANSKRLKIHGHAELLKINC